MKHSKIQSYSLINPKEIKESALKWKKEHENGGFIILLPENEKKYIKQFQKIFSDISMPFVGFLFPQIIIENKFLSTGLVIVQFDTMPYYFIQKYLSDDEIEYTFQMKEVYNQLKEKLKTQKAYSLFIIFDALVPKISSMLSELFILIGDRVTYTGVCCGSESFKPVDCIFTADKFYKNSAAFFLLEDKQKNILVHDYHVPKKLITATASSNNTVTSIDWQPAFDVYSKMAEEYYNVKITSSNFYEHAVHFPFGLIKADKSAIVRIPVALQNNKSIVCVGEIRENSFLTLLKAPDINKKEAVKIIAKQIKPKDNALLFYCAGRRMHFQDSAVSELETLTKLSSNEKISGALSLGEIGSLKNNNFPEFHNGAIVSMLL